MAELDRAFVRKLAEWTPGHVPVTSLYLSVDGRLYPRRVDYEVRFDDLLRRARDRAAAIGRDAARSVEEDAAHMSSFVRDRFDRGSTRGLALFSASRAGLWEDIPVSRPVLDRVVVSTHPDLLPLEMLLETYESFCTVLVDSEKARIFLAELGRIEEQSDLVDDVPGRHDQGGWSQARYQRHINEHRQRHLKRTAEVLFRFHKRRKFDHLILGGPDEVVAELERDLHDYLRRLVRARVGVPMTATASEVLARSLELEEEMERNRVRASLDRLMAQAAAGRAAVTGLASTLRALGDGRAETMLVRFDLSSSGFECPACGRLAASGGTCRGCGAARVHPVDDVVEAAVALAVRQGCRVETVTLNDTLRHAGGIGALLRY
jgi:peptide chain release factor subunit 1